MEKTETKRTYGKKRKTFQITYPAPYSQSWNPDILPVLMKNSVGRSTRSKRPLQSPRAWSQQFSDRPDPTAPHLKYGVFRNRRGSAPRPLIPNIDRIPKRMPLPDKQIKPTVNQSKNHVIKVPQVLISKKNAHLAPKKLEKKQSKSNFPPVFVIPNSERTNSRQLSQSKIMHMDIKPKRTPSPSFCPSPNFRTLPRKISPRRAFRLGLESEGRA